jgi:hypothetical protein
MTIGNSIMKLFFIMSTIGWINMIHLGIAESVDNTRKIT